ncbi:MAG: hypothetical protein HY081_07960 [Gammaproteobacteria bacterium]|nr:hypothetical protein [Gammaproteobacteria bacterium]
MLLAAIRFMCGQHKLGKTGLLPGQDILNYRVGLHIVLISALMIPFVYYTVISTGCLLTPFWNHINTELKSHSSFISNGPSCPRPISDHLLSLSGVSVR